MSINFRPLISIASTLLSLCSLMKWLQRGAISPPLKKSKDMATKHIPLISGSLTAEISGHIFVSRTHHLQSTLLTCIKSLLLSLNYTSYVAYGISATFKIDIIVFLKSACLCIIGPAYQVAEIEMPEHTQ